VILKVTVKVTALLNRHPKKSEESASVSQIGDFDPQSLRLCRRSRFANANPRHDSTIVGF
jgi:hypothetical protein